MKKLFIILIVLVAACAEDEPEPMKCYQCTTITTATGYSDTMTQKACGITREEANDLEAVGTGTTTVSGTTVKQSTKCIQVR